MSIVDEASQNFDQMVPFGEAAFMVLRAQLLAEHSVAQFIAARVPSLTDEIDDPNSPVRSGLALILLAQALSLRDEIPPTCADILWPALKKLNSLRNDLAHQLYPHPAKIERTMREFVKAVSGWSVSSTDTLNVNQQFRLSAQMLVAFLAVDREPFSLVDIQ